MYYKHPATDLTKVRRPKPGKSVEVTFAVSYRYNGGIVIDDEWYAGYEVPPPIVPEGFMLVGIGVGLELNSHPPYATQLMKAKT